MTENHPLINRHAYFAHAPNGERIEGVVAAVALSPEFAAEFGGHPYFLLLLVLDDGSIEQVEAVNCTVLPAVTA